MERPDAGGSPGRALVVDDEEAVRDLVTMALESVGYAVTDVASGAEAIESANAGEAFELVVLDLTLADMDGFAVHESLRREHATLPVLLMSGGIPESTPSGPHDAFLDKPFRLTELLGAISALLAASQEATA